MLPSHVVHNHNIALSWPTTQPKMTVMIIFVEYESTVYMAFVTKVFVKVTLSFLLCGDLTRSHAHCHVQNVMDKLCSICYVVYTHS